MSSTNSDHVAFIDEVLTDAMLKAVNDALDNQGLDLTNIKDQAMQKIIIYLTRRDHHTFNHAMQVAKERYAENTRTN